MEEREQNVRHFLELIRRSRRGKFKVYIGMSAGVGKTYRMLQEAHALLKNGIDVRLAYIETHNRPETAALAEGLPLIPRRKLFYKGRELEEMDLQAVLTLRPEVVIVDELAHTNLSGSKHEKRWQDVMEILAAGINVISAVNIQHLESLNAEVRQITGIEVSERVPDRVIAEADEVVNIDLTVDELLTRLREGKIYPAEKVESALRNFFRSSQILQLRELALREVASQVERKVESELPPAAALRHERFMACISSNEAAARSVIRKTARLAAYYGSKWFVLYVQTPAESPDAIPLDKQRHLIHHFKLGMELGAEILKKEGRDVARTIAEEARRHQITTLCLGRPQRGRLPLPGRASPVSRLLRHLASDPIDLIILAE